MIQLKRVYEEPARSDGVRFLVDRLWPRGIKKQDLRMASWQKDAGPSVTLRKWFSHDSAKWDTFRNKYFAELDAHPEAWEKIRDLARRGPVTLLYSSHDQQHNNAVALKEYLDQKLSGLKTAAGRPAGRG
jgi:uncharacterized protein YeaO (DUF488 family)